MKFEKLGKQEMIDMINVNLIIQKQTRGVGYSIICVKTFVVDEPFAVLLGDDIAYNEKSYA